MESIEKLLKSKAPKEPPQVVALKTYAQSHHGVTITVRVSSDHYLIAVPSAAVAQKMRFETAAITEKCELDKRLVIHIGYA
jgi:hypothetical protein